MTSQIKDPVELEVAMGLDEAGIRYNHDTQGNTNGLDFYLMDYDVYIECKAFHTERSNEQLKRAPNIILIQGIGAARLFRKLVGVTDDTTGN